MSAVRTALPFVGGEPALFARPFPWNTPLGEADLSTKRGFVFQYPPFPTLQTGDADEAETAGLYIHIPFCPYHCTYCYYAVEINQSASATERYIAALEKEIELWARRPLLRRHTFRTLFFGGGTPTYLEAEQLARVTALLRRTFGLDDLVEFTVESDPTTLTREKVQALRAVGVNRMSMGVQSFSTELNLLNERHHTIEESLSAWEAVRAGGMTNVNLDLICGLVGETERSWESTIDQLLALAPEHVTIYLFSLRPQTGGYVRIKSGRLPTPPEELQRIAMYEHAQQRLLAAGYLQTTPNCFIREPRFEQVHQRNAWSSLPLIGLGNSAYSFFDDRVTQNHRSVDVWTKQLEQDQLPVAFGQRLHARDLMIRYCVLRLKQLRISRREFQARFGFELLEVLGREIEALKVLALVKLDSEALALTQRGIIYVDDVCRAIYSRNVQERLAELEIAPTTPLIRSLV